MSHPYIDVGSFARVPLPVDGCGDFGLAASEFQHLLLQGYSYRLALRHAVNRWLTCQAETVPAFDVPYRQVAHAPT